MYPHPIRLRGPWEYETPGSKGRLTFPVALADTPLASHAGAVRFSRRFGYPGRIDPVERVWLRIESPAAPAALSLNGERIGECDRDHEWDITDRLRPRNELLVETAATPGEPWREVAMEVRRAAFLRGLRVWAEGVVIHAAGEVAGRADGPLELYLVADRRTAAYTTLNASAAGTPFALSGECAGGPPREAKVELVQGSVAWYTAEVALAPGRD
jgi:hypothetical protein